MLFFQLNVWILPEASRQSRFPKEDGSWPKRSLAKMFRRHTSKSSGLIQSLPQIATTSALYSFSMQLLEDCWIAQPSMPVGSWYSWIGSSHHCSIQWRFCSMTCKQVLHGPGGMGWRGSNLFYQRQRISNCYQYHK